MTRLLFLLLLEGSSLGWTFSVAWQRRSAILAVATSSGFTHAMILGLLASGACLAVGWLTLATLIDLIGVIDHVHLGGPVPRRSAPRWVHVVVLRGVGVLMIASLATPPPASAAVGSVVSELVDSRPPLGDPVVPPFPAGAPFHEGEANQATPRDADPSGGEGHSTDTAGTPQDPATVERDHNDLDSRTVIVGPGDNLWTIARAALITSGIDAPSEREVHRYWVGLLAANDVTSGDPDVIHPGERITLPPLPHRDAASRNDAGTTTALTLGSESIRSVR